MTPAEIVNAFITAVTSADWDRAKELVADDILYENVGFGAAAFEMPLPTITDSTSMVEFLGAMQDADWTVHREDTHGNVVVNERTDRFTFGEQRVEILVAGVFEVVDGRIAFWRDYFDVGVMNRQLGLA